MNRAPRALCAVLAASLGLVLLGTASVAMAVDPQSGAPPARRPIARLLGNEPPAEAGRPPQRNDGAQPTERNFTPGWAPPPEGLTGGSVQTVAKPVGGPRGGLDWRILQNPNGPHTVLFFDPIRRVFAVYQVDSQSGQIILKSVRSVAADLQLKQYNSGDPSPQAVEQMVNESP